MTKLGIYKDPDYTKKYRKRMAKSRNDYLREWRKRNLDKVKGYRLKTNYGISLEDYIKMVEERNSKCDICGKYTEKLHVDHCHETKIIRGLLCIGCNNALGKFEDSIHGIRKVLIYLEKVYG